jgi:hypothetical protein
MISAISFVHSLSQQEDPAEHPLVKRTLQGVKALLRSDDPRLPITLSMLHAMIDVASRVTDAVFACVRFKAMCALAFHVLLMVGERTESHNNLQLCHVSTTSGVDIIFAQFKHSAGIPSRHTIWPSSVSTCCPVRLFTDYLGQWGSLPGPLFLVAQGRRSLAKIFLAAVRSALALLGVDSNRFNTHSFRIGGASHLAMSGASDEQIRQLGRWSSNAFRAYIRVHNF